MTIQATSTTTATDTTTTTTSDVQTTLTGPATTTTILGNRLVGGLCVFDSRQEQKGRHNHSKATVLHYRGHIEQALT